MIDKIKPSQLVKELRTRLNLTQKKFFSKLRVTFPTINRWENERAKPSSLAMKQNRKSPSWIRGSEQRPDCFLGAWIKETIDVRLIDEPKSQ